jgi:hypothetical protein
MPRKSHLESHEINISTTVTVILQTSKEWEVSMSEALDPVFSFRMGPPRRTRHGSQETLKREFRIFDARGLRQLLFSEVKSPKDVLGMFKKLGPMRISSSRGEAPAIRFSQVQSLVKELETELLERKRASRPADAEGDIRKALREFRLWNHIDIELPFNKDQNAVVRRFDIQSAAEACIFLYKRDNRRWQRCERRGCTKLVLQKTARVKRYCDGVCAHAQYVSDSRLAKRCKESVRQGPLASAL